MKPFAVLIPGNVERAKELLADGASHQEVSRQTGLARDTVRRIFLGIPVGGKRGPKPKLKDLPIQQPQGKYVRCSGCGGKVMLPCVTCAVRAMKGEG